MSNISVYIEQIRELHLCRDINNNINNLTLQFDRTELNFFFKQSAKITIAVKLLT